MGFSSGSDVSLDEFVSGIVRSDESFSAFDHDSPMDLEIEDLEDEAEAVFISVIPRAAGTESGSSLMDQFVGRGNNPSGLLAGRATAEPSGGRVKVRIPKAGRTETQATKTEGAGKANAPSQRARKARPTGSSGPKPKAASKTSGTAPFAVRSEAATSAVATPPARHLRARLPEVIRPRERTLVSLFISQNAADELSAELLPFEIPPEGLPVKLSMHAPGFLVHDGLSRDLLVPQEGDSGQAVFEMEATREGELEVSVSAFAGSVHLGSLTFTVFVRDGEAPSESVERIAGIDFRLPEAGEATLEIEYDSESRVFEFQFRGVKFGTSPKMVTNPLGRSPDQAVEELVLLLNQNARGRTGLTPAAARKLLKNKGIELWEQLIPESLQDVFWESRDQVTRLNIISRDDVVPWELLYPFRPRQRDTGAFLAEMFPVSRWRHGASARPRLKLSNPAYVLPSGSPSAAQLELHALQNHLGEGSVLRTLDEVLERLDRADFGLIHFACHNRFDASDPAGPYIKFGKGQFQPSFLAEHRDRFRDMSPVVFMNACRTGALRMAYTRMDGWASYFLNAGAGAFIGSLWEVRDESARTFAEAFYGEFTGATTFGEALQTARTAASDDPADPTRLAYTVYGDLGALRI